MTNKEDLIKAIDAARPASPGSRYAMGYDDGLSKAKDIISKAGIVSAEAYKAVIKQRDAALAYIDHHQIQIGCKAPDVVRVVRCAKCKWFDPDSDYCQFWHGVRHPGHYCGEGEMK